MSYCSPKRNRNGGSKTTTCLDTEIINEMVDIYNKTTRGSKIDMGLSNDDKIKRLEASLKDEMPCEREYCLQYSPTLRPISKKLKKYYRPSVPESWKKNKQAWLNTLDIQESLTQYNEAYRDFHFLTVSPIDFDTRIRSINNENSCVDRNLCALDLANLVGQGFMRFGAVFNLDKHYQSGSHWTSLFADLYQGEAYYFDSVANYIPPEVVNLMLRINVQGNELLYSGKIALKNPNENRLVLQTNDLGEAVVSMTDLCNFMIRGNHFANYRFGFMFDEVPKTRFNIVATDELVSIILKHVLELVELTKKEGFIRIPDLDSLLKEHGQVVDSFTKEWTQSQVSLAISNFISSIKVLGSGGGNQYLISNWRVDGSNLIFTLDKPLSPSQTGAKLVDISIKCFKNYIQQQFKNTECGMYSIHFIDTLLTTDKTYTDIILHPLKDDILNNLRYTKYFTPH